MAAIPEGDGDLVRIHMPGVWAMDFQAERLGTSGGSVVLQEGRRPLLTVELQAGRHFSCARDLGLEARVNGDGTSLHELGAVVIEGQANRVDVLTVDVPEGLRPDALSLNDFGIEGSFVVFDVVAELRARAVCPFHSGGATVPLSELGTVVRVGDRRKFQLAVNQLVSSVQDPTVDLDEARGAALTFLAVVTAALLELGAPREFHRVQLEASRRLDRLDTREEVAMEIEEVIDAIARGYFADEVEGPSKILMDRALALVDRNFAKDISDDSISEQLGLSTSHFRFLFKQTTGKPFHKYLMSLRLERARQLLMSTSIPVQDIGTSVGFSSAAHFSRAFSQKFGTSPSAFRQTRR